MVKMVEGADKVKVEPTMANHILVIKVNVIKMGLRFKPVFVTGFLENQLIFVKSQEPVLGRSSGYRSLINEIQASSKEV